MSSFYLRFPSSFGNRPIRNSRDIRTRAVEPSNRALPQASGSVTAGGVPHQGGMPLICLPLLATAAALPIYGYNNNQRDIAIARKKYEEDIKAGRVQPKAPLVRKA